jgi:DNA invertase Pin-like site-specific DNA recombinase
MLAGVVLVWASDRIARSVRHFLDVLDELNQLNVEFVSFREQIDTGGSLGKAILAIIGAIAGLARNLIIERVRQHVEGQARKVAHRTQTSCSRSRRYPAG